MQLDCSVPGPFRNLRWRAAPDQERSGDDEVEIEVRAAGFNFRDVMYAMGLLPDEAVEDGFCGPTLGMEVAGIVTRLGAAVDGTRAGDAVIAFAPASFANRVRTRSLAVARKPAHWSFAAAATVPTAFFTAYYALHELARLREGERVLIHGAAGGVGIAAIQLAKHLGAEIFATAGSDAKRDFVRLLGADHVFDSRSLGFADEVMRASGGGVDVVLNSLAGDAIARNLRLLRPFGRMLELGKRDFYENSRVGLRPLRNNISYFGIDADQLLAQRPDTARRVFIDLMALFADGSLHPLPHRTFDAADIATAFRHMQASRHIGKVVVTFAPDFDPLGSPLGRAAAVAQADATYVVTGGLSGFGLRTAWWLVRHGARHLALLSRRGAAATPDAGKILEQFAAAGVSVACAGLRRRGCGRGARRARLDRGAHAAAARRRARGDGDRGRAAARHARSIAARARPESPRRVGVARGDARTGAGFFHPVFICDDAVRQSRSGRLCRGEHGPRGACHRTPRARSCRPPASAGVRSPTRATWRATNACSMRSSGAWEARRSSPRMRCARSKRCSARPSGTSG